MTIPVNSPDFLVRVGAGTPMGDLMRDGATESG